MADVVPLVKWAGMGQALPMRKFQKWAVIGRLASIALGLPGEGSKLARENELASSLGLSRPTLRHYRDAVENVRRVTDRPLRQRLFTGTAVAANTLTRWLRRDAVGAMAFIENNPVFTDAQVTAAARNAGPVQRMRGRLDLPLAALVGDALQWSGDGLNAKLQLDWHALRFDPWSFDLRFESREPKDPSALFLGVELELVLAPRIDDLQAGTNREALSEQTRFGAVVPIPHYVVFERYRQEARAIWARLVAASLLYPLVIAIFPGPAARRYFVSGIPKDVRASWAGLDRVNGHVGHKCRSQPVIFRSTPSGGLIVPSTRAGLAVDLFERARQYDVLPGTAPRRWRGPRRHGE